MEQNKPEEVVSYDLPHTLNLKEPIKVGSETIDKIVFRNRLLCHMVGHFPVGSLASLSLDQLFPVISEMTGETPKTIESMGWVDGKAAMEVVTYFLTSGQETGEQE